MADDVISTLAAVTTHLPGGGERRAGQEEMAEAVAAALEDHRHLVVQAGTGTGKSLAYLVPAVLSGRKVVVATATKALQDQLAGKDLPMVADAVGTEVSFAVLKGRSNYLCRQRLREVSGTTSGEQLAWTETGGDEAASTVRETPVDPGRLGEQVRELIRWSATTTSGDRGDLGFEPHPRAWSMVSTTARECPGAFRCPSGRECFAEDARARAAEADVVVVNTHLYGAHLASGGSVLPEHEVVIFDEAHELEEVMTDSLGVEISPGRFRSLGTTAKSVLTTPDGSEADATGGITASVIELADTLAEVLAPLAGHRLPGSAVGSPSSRDTFGLSAEQAAAAERLGPLLELASGRVTRLVAALRRDEREAGDGEELTARARRDRVLLAASHLGEDLARVAAVGDDQVAWVDGQSRNPLLRVSPINVGPLLAESLWKEVDCVLTSATIPLGLIERLGLPVERSDEMDVGSPFDYPHQAILYVAKDLPDRRDPGSEPAIHDELADLIEAAGGRTLALFTSWRAMERAVEALRERLDLPILAQSDRPKAALIEAFRADEPTCLFATLGFWQGVDVPGRTLSLVTIDRIPFPRPDEPVLQARRDRAGPAAFSTVDLPRAGTLLAQGAGRLIRSSHDRGVVAVLDSRLATARYRGALLARVPPMKRSIDRAAVQEFLRQVAEEAGS